MPNKNTSPYDNDCANIQSIDIFPKMSLFGPWNFPGKSTGVGCHFLLQGIFPTQGSNPSLPHCSQMLYRLSHQEAKFIAPLFTIAKTWKQTKCLLTDEWIKKM